MEKSHILWSEEEVIYVNGKECLNLEASIRVYEAFKSEFEKIGKIISPEVSKNLFLVDSVIKMEEARKEMALAYMEELKKKEAIESESPVEETTEEVSEQDEVIEEEHKYQDVIDFYNKHYGESTTKYGYNCLVSLTFYKEFSRYTDEEWLEISKVLGEKFANYEHTEQLERDFSTFLLTRKIVETKDITAGESIIPEIFVGRLALINSYLKKNPDKLAEFQLELDAEEVVKQFTKTFGPDVDYKNLLEFINKFWKAEQLYCYDAIVEYLNNNIKETEEELEDPEELENPEELDNPEELEDPEELDNPEELEDPEELDNPEEEETYTIIKRINKAKQTVKDHKKVVYTVLAGTGIISLLICTFVFGHNPISVISNCARAFKGLWASNPAFAPFFKRLGDLGAYFGAAFIGFKYSGKAIDEFIKDGEAGEDEEALEITDEELSLSDDDVESYDLDTLAGEESEVVEVEYADEDAVILDGVTDNFFDLDNLSATEFSPETVTVELVDDSTQKGKK